MLHSAMKIVGATQFLCYVILTLYCLRMGKSQLLAMNNVAESLHLFTNEFSQRIEHGDGTANLVISPASLFAAMSLASLGARGATLSQIQQVLRLSTDALTKKGGMTRIIASMTAARNQDVVVDMANLLWIPRGLAIKAEYAKSVQDIFQTRVRDADFSRTEEVRQVINQRIENITRGHITDLFPRGSVTKTTQLLLANAFYFKGVWLHAFNRSDTYRERFFMANGQSVMAPMMHGSGTFQAGILDNIGTKAIFMPYQGKRHGLLCVLPDRNKKLSDVENHMLSSGFTPTTMLRRMIHRDINITLPKLKMKFGAEMSHVFRKMGIRNLFTHEADLSGMSSDSSMLRVSSIYHQSTLEVNEGGSEASAATGLEVTPLMGGAGSYIGPMEFRADRPFLVYLIDRENDNIPLIMGRVSNPLQNQTPNLNRHYNSNVPSMAKTEQNNPNTFTKTDSGRTKFIAELARSEFRPPLLKPFPSAQFIEEDDQIIYPQKPSHINYYKSVKHFVNRYSSHFPRVSDMHTPIVFPDQDFDERRWKRELHNLTALPDVVSTVAPSTSENEAISTRLRDPLWFNKPTLPEVIIPINSPEPDSKPPTSFYRPANNFAPSPESSAGPELPTVTMKPEELSPLTGHTSSFALTPNIFFAPTIAPKPSLGFAAGNVNNAWNQNEQNEQNVGGAPGFAPSNGDIALLNNRPVILSSTWYPVQTNPYFPYPSSSPPELQAVFFPEYRFSSRN
ncbi:hypothetical protein GHT06_022499 [Daphnia sinensis]|uniref:Serpin domain-containing protein n=1 Tax=Daphnia sinensis TaxID=1820382 RepID=A0AAD5KH48_9CRUS|nr:hypothetical protein GHT06_022499 [Daphnia sinensis]